MFKALYSHVNYIIEKYLQIYNHILLSISISIFFFFFFRVQQMGHLKDPEDGPSSGDMACGVLLVGAPILFIRWCPVNTQEGERQIPVEPQLS